MTTTDDTLWLTQITYDRSLLTADLTDLLTAHPDEGVSAAKSALADAARIQGRPLDEAQRARFIGIGLEAHQHHVALFDEVAGSPVDAEGRIKDEITALITPHITGTLTSRAVILGRMTDEDRAQLDVLETELENLRRFSAT